MSTYWISVSTMIRLKQQLRRLKIPSPLLIMLPQDHTTTVLNKFRHVTETCQRRKHLIPLCRTISISKMLIGDISMMISHRGNQYQQHHKRKALFVRLKDNLYQIVNSTAECQWFVKVSAIIDQQQELKAKQEMERFKERIVLLSQ